MRKIIFTLFCSSMACLAFGQVTLNSSDNGSKSLSTASGGNFSLLRGTSTIGTWSGTQTGATYFVTGHSGGTGIASVASGSSSGSSFSLQITNNTGYTITDLAISGTILLCKDNNTPNTTETLTASGPTGASNWSLSVTSNNNSVSNVSVPPDSPGSFGGTLTGYSFTTGTNITITWSDANDGGTDAMFGFNEASLSWTPPPLPIELLKFSARTIDQSTELSWSTAIEKDNDYMAVERSVNGENFSEIGRVKGAGSSLERIDYSFTDRFPYQGTNYYRLRQVDYDGTTTYHKVIAVEFTGESVNTLGFVPTAEGIQVQFRAPGAGGEIILVDAAGRILQTQKFDGQSTTSQISTAGLPRGFYVVQVRRADGKLEAWPLVK